MEPTEVIQLKKVEADPNPAMIKTIETLLAQARAGKITLFVATVKSDQTWVQYSHGVQRVSDILAAVGMLDAVKNRMLNMISWGSLGK